MSGFHGQGPLLCYKVNLLVGCVIMGQASRSPQIVVLAEALFIFRINIPGPPEWGKFTVTNLPPSSSLDYYIYTSLLKNQNLKVRNTVTLQKQEK